MLLAPPTPTVTADIPALGGKDGNDGRWGTKGDNDGDGGMRYYADFAVGSCTLQQPSAKMPWDRAYDSEYECCSANFSWKPEGNSYAGDVTMM